MCTLSSSEPHATVCDVALPFVRAALAREPRIAVEYRPTPGDGTEIRLLVGDPSTFERHLRAAIAQANE
jgi:hypothetical protein